MSEKNIQWTDQQTRAIQEHTRSVLVAASAGTGKTAVLSGRCVDIVKNCHACPDVCSILVLTFTDMAAGEMRSRIAKQLKEAIESAEDKKIKNHLRHQLILLGAADISTIHSFCKRLITEHFYLLDLDPTFRVIDADEATLLKTDALEKAVEFCWNQNNLAGPMSELLSRRNLDSNNGFLNSIIDISDFLDTLVSREDWLSRAQILAETIDPFSTDLAEFQKHTIEKVLSNAIEKIRHAENVYKNVSGDKNGENFLIYIQPVEILLNILKKNKWDVFIDAANNFSKPRVTTPKIKDKNFDDFIHDTVKESLDSIDEIRELAIINPGYLSNLKGSINKQTKVLIDLVRQFDKFYRQAKTAINGLDFADLEHYVLRLLTGEKSAPSQTALKLREKYKFIFVDEFQDINSVQQTILNLIGNPDNIFAVGDPKQSIYQWRGANPQIFLDNLKLASIKPTRSQTQLRVDLTKNFRSEKLILDFVNLIFSKIMTASFANMTYDKTAFLEPAADSDASPSYPIVELHIIDKPPKSSDEDSDNDSDSQFSSKRQRQALLIANKIKQLIGNPEFLITDKKTKIKRPIEYRDIVILMRSIAGRNDFLETLTLAGIPISCQASAGYFEATEITDMLSLLKVLDNPRRDIELAAVLRSPLFNFTDTELAQIHLWDKRNNSKSSFYDCVIGCSSSASPELSKKLNETIARLENWRTIARRGRIAELIWNIFRQTGFLSFVSVLSQPDARRANLLKLHDRAIQFEGFASASGVPSLTRFIDFIEKLIDARQDWSPAEPESAVGNAVRVLSVHKSKGLEFPVVFLAETEGEFKKSPNNSDCLFDENFTLGFQYIDSDSNSLIDTLAYQVIGENYRRKSLAEEMRILYVAMTRAINRLILVGSKRNSSCLDLLKSVSFFDGPIPDWHLDSCSSHLDWLLCAIGQNPAIHSSLASCGQFTDNNNLFTIQLYDEQKIQNSRPEKIINNQLSIINYPSLAKIKDSLNWTYSYPNAPLLPAKRSVSQYTHRNDEFTIHDYSDSFSRLPQIFSKDIHPADMSQAKEIGSATHLVLSMLDLDKPVTVESINSLIKKLLTEGSITASIAQLIDIGSLLRFFETDLGQLLFDKNNKISREWPFTYALPSSEWLPDAVCHSRESGNLISSPEPRATPALRSLGEGGSDDFIIIQGIIDLLIQTPAGLIIIDFKTDDVAAENISNRAELYHLQLTLYARAACAILKQTVSAKYLYFLKSGISFEI